jgi:predicted O-methyltransferase YrrM
MSLDVWTALDEYINAYAVSEDDALRAATEAAIRAGLPAISVTPSQGKLLYILARLQRARTILEIGTLAAYSTIWLARAVAPNGRVVTLESDPKHAAVARDNLARAGLSDVVEVIQGEARDTLPGLSRADPFDVIFIDADKKSIPEYFDSALELSGPGSLIIVDNVIREGAVIDTGSTDPNILGVRRFNERLARSERVSATTIQTVGSKGYDGFTIALVNASTGAG